VENLGHTGSVVPSLPLATPPAFAALSSGPGRSGSTCLLLGSRRCRGGISLVRRRESCEDGVSQARPPAPPPLGPPLPGCLGLVL
jgi:hypothetical protein